MGQSSPAPDTPPIDDVLLGALVADALIDDAGVARARELAIAESITVEEALLRLQLLEELVLLKFCGGHYQTHFLSTKKLLQSAPPDGGFELVPGEVARRHLVVPLRMERDRGRLTVACVRPDDSEMLAALSSLVGVESVHAVVAVPEAIRAAITQRYGVLPAAPGGLLS